MAEAVCLEAGAAGSATSGPGAWIKPESPAKMARSTTANTRKVLNTLMTFMSAPATLPMIRVPKPMLISNRPLIRPVRSGNQGWIEV